MQPSEIGNAYQNLWLKFKATCEGAGYKLFANPSNGYRMKMESGRVAVVNSLISLPGWPYKAQSKKSVHIIIRSSERFGCDQNEMTSSTIQVLYFEGKGQKATPLLALHYDFDTPVQIAHPVFHAQLGFTKLTKEERESIGFRREIPLPDHTLYGNARIPTPHMNLGSVLLAVVADHLPAPFYGRFLNDIRQNQAARWDAACSSLRTSLKQNGGYLHSHHWY